MKNVNELLTKAKVLEKVLEVSNNFQNYQNDKTDTDIYFLTKEQANEILDIIGKYDPEEYEDSFYINDNLVAIDYPLGYTYDGTLIHMDLGYSSKRQCYILFTYYFNK